MKHPNILADYPEDIKSRHRTTKNAKKYVY